MSTSVIEKDPSAVVRTRPWPRRPAMTSMPCSCTGATSRCGDTWIRCNTRLAAVRAWQWQEEERRGLGHPPGACPPEGNA